MGRYWKLLAEYDGEAITYAACAGAFATSPYTPEENAKLIALRIMVSNEAATSLTEAVQFKLTHAKFKPQSIEVGGLGGGLHTAPAFPVPFQDWIVEQVVQGGLPIKIEARNITAETPVTVEVYLWGYFES